jgi:hypothetical protein
MRNDLSDADLEVVPAASRAERPKPDTVLLLAPESAPVSDKAANSSPPERRLVEAGG